MCLSCDINFIKKNNEKTEKKLRQKKNRTVGAIIVYL